jgi:hypothetical protein
MPSEAKVHWLRSQGFGFVCAQATVLLLGLGSFIIASTRDDASAELTMDEVRPFFTHPRPLHAWFYLLLGVLTLYALNTGLCTFDSLRARFRRGALDASSLGSSVIHVSFLIGLGAHLVGGLWNEEQPTVRLSPAFSALDDGAQARVTQVTFERTPSGKVKDLEARVELREADGTTHSEPVGYNQPLSRHFGTELFLVAQAGDEPVSASVTVDGQACELALGGSCGPVTLTSLQGPGRSAAGPVARFSTASGGRFSLAEGGARALDGGARVTLLHVGSQPLLQLRHRHTPGFPLAGLSALALAAGLLMMGRRWLKPPSQLAATTG